MPEQEKNKKNRLIKKNSYLVLDIQRDWDWAYALRGYAIFATLIVALMVFVDHFIVAIALMLMMNAWVIMGAFSISDSLRKDISDEERKLANIRNTVLFTTGTFLPIIVIFSGTGKLFVGLFTVLILASFLPSWIGTLSKKLPGVINVALEKITTAREIYAYYEKSIQDFDDAVFINSSESATEKQSEASK